MTGRAPRRTAPAPEIRIESLLEGAVRARGTVAVIDVLRAFTTAAVVLARGARRVVMVAGVEEALALRAAGLGRLCMGEEGGRMPPGFDLGNSPVEAAGAEVQGATVIQRSSAGTQGVVAAARNARRLYAAALVTAGATARAVAAAADTAPGDGGTGPITLVAMGRNGRARTEEDELCALHLRMLLEGRPGDPEALRRLVMAGGEAARFLDPGRPHLDPRDLEVALDLDRYPFAVRVTLEDGRPTARMEHPPS